MRTEEVGYHNHKISKESSGNLNVISPFRSLRSRLTLSYSIVTIGALLVVELVVVVFLMLFFVNNIDLTPENLIANLREEWTPMMQQFFSSEPPDVDGARAYLEDVQGTVISTRPLLIFGNLQLQMKVEDFLHFYYLLNDRTLVYAIPHGIVPEEDLGQVIPFDYLPGLSNPLRAAMQGIEDQNELYEMVEPGNRIVGAIPIFRFEPTDIDILYETQDTLMDVERNLVGVVVFTTKHFPWQFLPFGNLMIYIGRSLLVFTLFAGLLGSVFGLLTANSLTRRLTRVSKAAHDWSRGNFSVSIRDTSNDEIGKLTDDLNIMAEQLETLMDRRQELSVLEERNRLARDLHDSVKQQAFAASAQLGAAKAHFEQQPDQAFSHLLEADLLIGNVRQELTELIQELRPVEIKGKGLISAVEEYANDWRRRNNIEVNMQIWGERSLPLDVEKCVFRIIQEALANVLWHSNADQVDIVLDYWSDSFVLRIKDNGKGFDYRNNECEGMGLKFMCERAALIGGELDINSTPGHGTEIILKYPYKLSEL
jgi:two-component system, NarL family, sensor histidine kinase LiaS